MRAMIRRLLHLMRRRNPPAQSVRRRPQRQRGDRKGDEILYPTDRFTEDMQPKK